MKTKRLAVFLVLAGLGVAATLANATGSGFDWEEFFPFDETVTFSVLIGQREEPGDPLTKRTVTVVERGPLLAGTLAMSAFVKTERTEEDGAVLVAVRLMTADDQDGSGVIEQDEWTTEAGATAAQAGSWLSAQTPTVVVGAFHDRYRIESDWWDVADEELKTHYDDVGDSDIAIAD